MDYPPRVYDLSLHTVGLILGLLLLALFAARRPARLDRLDNERLRAPAEALGIYRAQFPDASGEATLDADGKAALIALQHPARIGLLRRHGQRWNAREITSQDVRSVEVRSDSLVVSLKDFGWPRTHMRIEDPGQRAQWLSRLQQRP